MESERADQEWKLALTRFATENYDQIFASDEAKRARLRALMNATFPSDLLREFYEEQTKSATTFTEIAELSDAYAALDAPQQDQASQLGGSPHTQATPPAATQAPRIASSATIYLQYADEKDLPTADQLLATLRSEGFRTPGSELISGPAFSADVRYFHADDRQDAERALAALTGFLSARGLDAPSSSRDLSTSFPNVPEGVVEVWLPRLPDS